MRNSTKPTVVVNIRDGEPYDVYIGRPSKWGNPFKIGPDGDREEVIDKYVHWLLYVQTDLTMAEIQQELRGKALGCYCLPENCHGMVLAGLADFTDTIVKLITPIEQGDDDSDPILDGIVKSMRAQGGNRGSEQ